MTKSDKYISLKEASEISSYAPDYVGQLIRKGKLPGKQVYHAVAWMTTEKALREYLAKNRGQRDKDDTHERLGDSLRRFANTIRTEAGLVGIFRVLLHAFFILLVGFAILLFYVFSVNVDKKLEKRALEKVERHPVPRNE